MDVFGVEVCRETTNSKMKVFFQSVGFSSYWELHPPYLLYVLPCHLTCIISHRFSSIFHLFPISSSPVTRRKEYKEFFRSRTFLFFFFYSIETYMPWNVAKKKKTCFGFGLGSWPYSYGHKYNNPHVSGQLPTGTNYEGRQGRGNRVWTGCWSEPSSTRICWVGLTQMWTLRYETRGYAPNWASPIFRIFKLGLR